MKPARGEILLEHATRIFAVRADRGRTLKSLLVRGRKGGDADAGGVHALDDVTLRIAPGETVGLIGRNGAGKTSTLRVLGGIVGLTSGQAACGGRVVSLLELGAGFGRDFSGRENVFLNGALNGLSRREIEERYDAIAEFSELGDFLERPVRTYSAGMYVRLGFAIAAHLEPDVMLVDEVLAVGDEAFQRKCLRRIGEHVDRGVTLVLVSHDPGAIERTCARTVVLERGRVAYDGPTPEGIVEYHRLLGAAGTPEAVRRVGTGALAVERVWLQDGEGRPTNLFRTGSALGVRIAVRAAAEVPRSRVVLEVLSAGRRVFRTEASPAFAAGPSELAFDVPRLALLGGDYDLAVAVGEGREDEEPGFDRVSGFSVVHEPDREGLADLAGAWQVRAAAPEVLR